MTLFSPDTKVFISHYRLVLKPTFILPFGLEANFILPFGLVSEFHVTVRPGTGFHITVPEFFVSGEYRVICAPPNHVDHEFL
jgi:hypothetical protein